MKKKDSLKDEIRKKIITEILNGNFLVNSVITEKMLIEMFNVSKSPIREALVELCNEKVLQSMPRYGYRIVQLDENDIANANEIRLLLEVSGLEKAVQFIGDEEIAILKKYNDECEQNTNTEDVWIHWNNNIGFHLLLNSFAKNQWMNELLNKTLSIMIRAYAQYYWRLREKSISDINIEKHREIVTCLENKEYDLAIQKLKEDILALRIW